MPRVNLLESLLKVEDCNVTQLALLTHTLVVVAYLVKHAYSMPVHPLVEDVAVNQESVTEATVHTRGSSPGHISRR